MTKAEIFNPEGWPRPSGYSNVVVMPKGRDMFIAGMIGWDENEKLVSDVFAEQFERALLNIKICAEAAGSAVEYIGRLTVYVNNISDYKTDLKAVGAAYRRVFGDHYPAMALMEVGCLVDDGALCEIEATGVVPNEQ